jgi:hypothetical protein
MRLIRAKMRASAVHKLTLTEIDDKARQDVHISCGGGTLISPACH